MALDEQRRAAITKFEQAQARRNAASKEIGQAKAKKDEAAAQKLMAEVTELKTRCRRWRPSRRNSATSSTRSWRKSPTCRSTTCRTARTQHGNVEHHEHGAKRDYAFKPKQHFELGEALGMMDFELAAKLSGARFVVLQKGLARMERALGQFMLDLHTEREAWLHRSQSAAVGARRRDVRHGAIAEV